VKRTSDAIVIGAGIIGGAIAFELAKRGMEVVVVDKAGAPGHGSTSSSSAIVRFNYSTFDGVATSWEAMHYWERWPDHVGRSDESGLATFHRTGMVVLDTPIAPLGHVAKLLGEAGVPFEEWDSAALRSHVPGIDTGAYWPPKRIEDDAFFDVATRELDALYMPDAGFVDDPQLAAHNLIAAAKAHGATVVLNRTITGVMEEAGRVAGVQCSDGERIDARIIINASGPWSGQINQMAGVGSDFTVTTRPLRQEVHYLPAPPNYNPRDGLGPSIADMDLGIYIRASHGDRIYVGGTEPACDDLEWVADPQLADMNVTADNYARQSTRAARRLSTLALPTVPKGIAGVYDVTDDWQPIYDRTSLTGFYVAIGTSGNQFKNAPFVGRLLAELVESVEAGRDHDQDPLKVQGQYTSNVINMGAFSRKRVLNTSSSGTVMGWWRARRWRGLS
jgi:glycine/D-amino acid oxidase-like deaminating enzyme